LVKSTLSSALEAVLESKPDPVASAASDWAQAYLTYAASAMSSVSSLATNASGNQSILIGAFSSALASQDSSGAASTIASGVMAFWQAIVWSGASAVGTTSSPGNFSLSASLSSIFSDTGEASAGDKANSLADAFDAGARQVMVMDILTSSGVPVVGPIQ
jgi:hypothetical protein